MSEIHYKIRRRGHNMYSKGTMYYQWNEKGKTFDTIGKLRSYITRCMNDEYMRKFLHEFEVIEYEVSQRSIKELVDIVKPEKIMELLKS
jgi:hypothetical protein